MRICKHPCPGCRKTEYYGLKGSLCIDCKDTLKIGTDVKNARKTSANAKVGTFMIPWAYYAFPYFPHGDGLKDYKTADGFEGNAKEVFERSFYETIKLLSEPSRDPLGPPLITWKSMGSHHNKQEPVRMRTDVAAQLTEIYTAVALMVENAYKQGKMHGEDLIARLASGELSVNEVNKQSISGKAESPD